MELDLTGFQYTSFWPPYQSYNHFCTFFKCLKFASPPPQILSFLNAWYFPLYTLSSTLLSSMIYPKFSLIYFVYSFSSYPHKLYFNRCSKWCPVLKLGNDGQFHAHFICAWAFLSFFPLYSLPCISPYSFLYLTIIQDLPQVLYIILSIPHHILTKSIYDRC